MTPAAPRGPVAYRARRVLGPTLQWRADAALLVEDGLITDIVDDVPSGVPCVDLGPSAVVPGQVNAHSHAFQRAIRGRTEATASALGGDDDFWTWRRQMYAVALTCDLDEVALIARMAFIEMALSGITSVGEFHYLHHQPDGTPYPDPNAMAHRIIEAARAVGLRITLLRVAYHRAGFAQPPNPDQRRFVEPSVEVYLARADALRQAWAGDDRVTIGLAPHSIRAVPAPWLRAIAAHVTTTPQPVHVHVCEQPAELAQSVREYGCGPIEVLDRAELLGPGTTLVHAIHLDDTALALLKQHRPMVCACPSTERNLGDGVIPARALMEAGIPLCLGSDSHTQIDPWAEMRQVEYHERLLHQRRNVLAPFADDGQTTARALWPMGTTHGAESLGQAGGLLAPGAPADFVALDLEHPTLAGLPPSALLAGVVFSMPPGAVREVYVGGEAIVEGGVHPLARATARAYAALMDDLDARTLS